MKAFKTLVSALIVSSIALGCSDDNADGAPSEEQDREEQAHTFMTAEQLRGTYLLVVSTTLAPRIPVVYLAELEAEEEGDTLALRLRERPLSKLDRKTAVGPWSEWTDASVDKEGNLESGSLHITIPSDANALTGLDTEVEIVLSGQLSASDAQTPTDFICGAIGGRIVGPIPLDDLSGSTFTATRLDDSEDLESYPDAVINCQSDPARPL